MSQLVPCKEAVMHLIEKCQETIESQDNPLPNQLLIIDETVLCAGDQQRQLLETEFNFGARVQKAIREGMALGILDAQGRLRIESLIERGLIDPEGRVIHDIFGRSVPCQE